MRCLLRKEVFTLKFLAMSYLRDDGAKFRTIVFFNQQLMNG
jgi:hypothetical protein